MTDTRKKVLVVANQKGGVGKTAVAVHLAYHMAETGLRVVVVDLDTQANASFSLAPTSIDGGMASALFRTGFTVPASFDGPGIMLIRSDGGLADLERALSPDDAARAFGAAIKPLMACADVVLIDTAPSLGNAMASALVAASHVLSPMELETYSLQGIEKMLTVIGNLRAANPGLNFLGMLPSKVRGGARHAKHLDQLRRAFPDMVLPVVVPFRNSIADALGLQRPVWKLSKSAARKTATDLRPMLAHVTNAVMEC